MSIAKGVFNYNKTFNIESAALIAINLSLCLV